MVNSVGLREIREKRERRDPLRTSHFLCVCLLLHAKEKKNFFPQRYTSLYRKVKDSRHSWHYYVQFQSQLSFQCSMSDLSFTIPLSSSLSIITPSCAHSCIICCNAKGGRVKIRAAISASTLFSGSSNGALPPALSQSNKNTFALNTQTCTDYMGTTQYTHKHHVWIFFFFK